MNFGHRNQRIPPSVGDPDLARLEVWLLLRVLAAPLRRLAGFGDVTGQVGQRVTRGWAKQEAGSYIAGLYGVNVTGPAVGSRSGSSPKKASCCAWCLSMALKDRPSS